MGEFTRGLYEVMTTLNIRREPRLLPANIVGRLTIGTQRQVYSVMTDANNTTWGRISETDSAGIAQWVCMKDINRQYVKSVSFVEVPTLESRFAALEAWARSKGYLG